MTCWRRCTLARQLITKSSNHEQAPEPLRKAMLDALDRVWAALVANAKQVAAPSPDLAAGETPVTVRDLLQRSNLPTDKATIKRLDERLRRFRSTNWGCFMENESRTRNTPSIFYFPSKVTAVMDAFRASLAMRR